MGSLTRLFSTGEFCIRGPLNWQGATQYRPFRRIETACIQTHNRVNCITDDWSSPILATLYYWSKRSVTCCSLQWILDSSQASAIGKRLISKPMHDSTEPQESVCVRSGPDFNQFLWVPQTRHADNGTRRTMLSHVVLKQRSQ